MKITREHISGVKGRRELISVWEDVGGYLMGEEKKGTYLSVGARGSVSQGWRRVAGVYYRDAEEGEHISGMKKRRELISVWEDGSESQGWRRVGGLYIL